MFWIYVLITSLAGTVLAKGPTDCDLNDSSDTHRCFAALGGPLIFHLPTDINIRMSLQKDENIFFSFAKNTGLLMLGKHWKIGKNCHDFKNGTFIVDKVSRNDSGDFQQKVNHAANGTLIRKTKIILKILAAVSEPAVSQTCLSPDLMTVSCSAEGDDVNLTLSLDKNKLIQSRSAENKGALNVTVDLHGQLGGKLMCDVHNNVSHKQRTIQLTSCKGVTSVAVAVLACVLVLLLILSVFLGIKLFNQKKSLTADKNGDPEDEVVYSDVRVVQLQ